MVTKAFSLFRDYEIKCKQFIPENKSVRNVIIGVHGFAGDKESSMLLKLAESCEEYGVSLICFDFPAHGESPADEKMLSVDNCRKDLLCVAEHVLKEYPDIPKSIFATSFGGYITLLSSSFLEEFQLVLRAPAVTMPKLILDSVLCISADDFKNKGFIDCGFERRIKLPYSFYEELLQQDDLLMKKIERSMLIMHGDCDDIVPLSDIIAFSDNRKGVSLEIINGADHRFKKNGEIEKVVLLTKEFLGFI